MVVRKSKRVKMRGLQRKSIKLRRAGTRVSSGGSTHFLVNKLNVTSNLTSLCPWLSVSQLLKGPSSLAHNLTPCCSDLAEMCCLPFGQPSQLAMVSWGII